MIKIAILVCVLFCVACELQEGTFTDIRDSKVYKTIKIGEQVWFAENLNYEADGSKCYENKPANCDKYGRLYSWKTAMKSCPDGWHLPSKAEWEVLMESVVGEKTENQFDFFALSGGYGYSSGFFYDLGNLSYWWSANEYGSYSASRKNIYYINEYADDDSYVKNILRSVRCVKK
ncbi:MAG: hypothetical protein LBC75_08610 [Fibromonadaceae bacterium]|jgi:uncharacterized protein (TIGR02145 family)|nr:hypothetical protein [Fibromonadaceae bacterium]